MRIGIVLFGHLRSFRQTLSSFKELKKTLEKHGQVDVFCHTWDIEESVTAAWWKEHKTDNPPSATVNAKEIEEKYAPVRYTIESSKQFDDSGYEVNTSVPIPGILSMLYAQQRSFELLKQYETEKNFRYDVIIKTRYDLLYEIAPGFNDIIQDCLTNSKVYLPSSNPYELIGSYSDILAVGSRDEMEKYFDFCYNFIKAVSLYQKKGYRQLIPEVCMSVYLEELGLKRTELTGLRINVLRMNGEKFQINSDRNFRDNGPLCFYSATISECKKITPSSSKIVNEQSNQLVKKYLEWIDKDANENQLNCYVDFYNGKWVGLAVIRRMVALTKQNTLFTRTVIRNFFEEAMYYGKYDPLKKLQVAFILFLQGGQGIFFFRVWMNLVLHRK